uniref:Microtubule-associated protein Jupiter n=1 Tax=Syphacia muris TaxID=451379 RepID=A0A0N5ABB2_9BILA
MGNKQSASYDLNDGSVKGIDQIEDTIPSSLGDSGITSKRLVTSSRNDAPIQRLERVEPPPDLPMEAPKA